MEIAAPSSHLTPPGSEAVRFNRKVVIGASLAIFLLALGLRLLYLQEARESPFYDNLKLILDSRYYDAEAQRVAHGDLIGDLPFYLGPLYSYLMGAVYAALGRSLHAIKVIQALVGAGSCVLLYHITRRIWGEWAGIIAGLFLALYGYFWYQHSLVLPTSLEVFINLCVLMAFIPRKELSVARSLAGGIAIGLAAVAKGNAILLLPGMGLAILLGWCGAAPRFSRRLVLCGWMVAGTTLAIAPVTVRNYYVSGEWVLLTTTGGRNFLKGNGPTATGTHAYLSRNDRGTDLSDYLSYLEKKKKGKNPKPIDVHQVVAESGELARDTWQYIGEHPGRTAALWLKKLRLFFYNNELGIRDQFYFAREQSALLQLPWPSFGFVAPLGIAGAVMAWPNRRRCMPLYVMLAVQIVSFVLIFVLGRYRLPAVSVLMAFASCLIVAWIGWTREHRWGKLIMSMLIAAVAAIVVNWPMDEFPRDRGFAVQHELLGDVYYDRQQYEEAVGEYRAALTADWQDEDVPAKLKKCWQRLGQSLLALGRREEALSAFESGLAHMREYPRARWKEQMTGTERIIGQLKAGQIPDVKKDADDLESEGVE